MTRTSLASRVLRALLLAGLIALAFLLLPPASSARPASEDTFSWSGAIAAGDTIEIKNLNGPILAEGAAGDRVEVEAVKEGPAAERDEVTFEVVERDGGVTICAMYPGHRNRCAPGDEGNIGGRDNHTKVTFRVRVPAGVHLAARTLNGAIEAKGLRAEATLLTLNGAIEVTTAAAVQAKTMNGRVACHLERTAWEGEVELETMNGRIEVTLPADADVEVDGATMHGRIDSDWPLETSGWFRNKAQGRIGEGGRRLKLRTMNGSITLRRG